MCHSPILLEPRMSPISAISNVIEGFRAESDCTTSLTLIKFSRILTVLGLPEVLGFSAEPFSSNIRNYLRLHYGEGRYHL